MTRRLFALILAVSALTATVAPPLTARADGGREVRVRLLELNVPRTVIIEAPDGLSLFAGGFDTQPIRRLAPGETATLTLRDAEIYLSLSDGLIHARSLQAVPPPGGAFVIEVTDGETLSDPLAYAGRLSVTPLASPTPALRLVNHVGLDDYIASVVTHEYGFDDVEGSKAMAVVVRTYTLKTAGKFGDAYDHVDHIGSQVYGGLAGVSPVARAAARATRGEVLLHGGEPIEAVYFAASGGHTANNEDVWTAAALPYLRGKPDPHDHLSPYGSWSSTVPRDRLLKILSETYSIEATGFFLADRGADGRVRAVDLRRADGRLQRIPPNDFRLLVNRHFGVASLRSMRFNARRDGDAYVFEGSGYGHGVGLSQWGAHAMALAGKSYRDILSFYYTGATLRRLEGDAAERPGLEPSEPTRRRVGW